MPKWSKLPRLRSKRDTILSETLGNTDMQGLAFAIKVYHEPWEDESL